MSVMSIARRVAVSSAATLVVAMLWLPAALAWEKVYTDDGAAIEGYDPVAYFTDGRPVEGKAEFEATHDGATWRFASAANRNAFVANPQRYAPQYGGYCAYAVSEGYTASIDPDAWSIVDGKLYLNYSSRIQHRWQKSRDERIAQGDRNWPLIVAGDGRLRN